MATQTKTSKTSLTIYLIKDDISKPSEIIKDFNLVKRIPIRGIGDLYYVDSHPRKPSWLQLFEKHLSVRPTLLNSSSQALFFASAPVDSNTTKRFAITFGTGRNLLNRGVYEERFGLRATLNAVAPNSLKRINAASLAAVSKLTSEQHSREGDISEFGFNIEQDLVRSVTAISTNAEFGKTMTGQDALKVTVPIIDKNIKDFLISCYKKYAATNYKKHFAWIDHIAEIRDISIINELNVKMLEKLKTPGKVDIWMAVPEIINWADVDGFKFGGKRRGPFYQDISLQDFFDSLSQQQIDNISLDFMKNKKVYCYSASQQHIMHYWTALECMYCEVQLADINKTFVLNSGKWYEVDNVFAKRVNSEYEHLRQHSGGLSLPDFDRRSEAEYNDSVAKMDASICSMDGENIMHGGGRSRIEFCDLFTKDNNMIHVKRYGASSVLSHLFQQGVTSAELFMGDDEFRQKVSKKLPETHPISSQRPKENEFKVTFAIISKFSDPLQIPFFSKVSLRNAKQRLKSYGYQVFLTKVLDRRAQKSAA